jgi:hypothetical protein
VRHHVDVPACFPAIVDGVDATLRRNCPAFTIAKTDAGIRNEHVDGAEVFFYPVHECRNRLFIAHVERRRNATDFRGNFAGGLIVDIGDNDLSTVPGESATQRSTNAMAATRNYCNRYFPVRH